MCSDDDPAAPVLVQRDQAILEITLNRPKANAIDPATSRALGRAFTTLRDDPDLRVGIIWGGSGRIFCAGWDLKAAASGALGEKDDYGPGGFAGLTEMFDLDKPVIAAVNGTAVGGGFELMLACDIVVAVEDAEFFLPEAMLGIAADAGGLQRLPKRLPHHVAMDLLLTGRRMTATEAFERGLVAKVVPSGQSLVEARRIAALLAKSAPLSIATVKQCLRGMEHLSVAQSFAALRDGQFPAHAAMLASPDADEGPRAFAERRDPVFRGG
jgi:crotonobetainyl-CoA hydratase